MHPWGGAGGGRGVGVQPDTYPPVPLSHHHRLTTTPSHIPEHSDGGQAPNRAPVDGSGGGGERADDRPGAEPSPAPPPPPVWYHVGCHVYCWLTPVQHNRQHMQFTKRKEKLVKSRARPSAPFAKGLWEKCAEWPFAWERGRLHQSFGGRFRTARAQRQSLRCLSREHPPELPPPTEACMIHSKGHRGCTVQDPGTCGYRRWKTADFSHSAGTAHGVPPCST